MKLTAKPVLLSKRSNPFLLARLFSYPYKSPFPQLLSFTSIWTPGCVPFVLFPLATRHFYLTPFPLITSLQILQFHAITHSFAQRRTSIYPVLNSFRTLSIATGVVPPCRANVSTSTSRSPSTRRKLRLAGMQCPRHPSRPTLSPPQTCQPCCTNAKIHATPL